MTVAAYTTDLTTQTLSVADATTGWAEPTAIGWTAAGAPTNQTENFIQGVASVGSTYKATGVGGELYNNGSGVTIPADGAFLCWGYYASMNGLDTEAAGGMRLMIGSALTAFDAWKVAGSDTLPYGGWKNYAASPEVNPDYTAGTPSGTLQYFGFAVNSIAAISKGEPYAVDVIRYGRCEARINGGTSPDQPATFSGFAAANDATAARWGLIQAIDGGYLWKGLLILGYTSAVDFRDSNTQILVDNTKKVTAGFNKIEIRQAASRVDWTNIGFQALGTVSRGRFEVIDNCDVNIDGCTFTDLDTFIFKATSSIVNSTLRRCSTITANGAVLNGSTVATPTITADESALLWNVADGDPDGNLDDMTFSKGTNDHHAISLTPNAATTDVTLRRITFTGFFGTEGSTAENHAVLELEDRGADTTWNINLVSTSGAISYKKRRGTDTVNLIANPVTLTVTVVDLLSGLPIQNVNVLVEAAAGGPLSVGTDIIKALTDMDGQVADTRTYASNQPITGRARLATTGGPLYKTGSIAGIINSANGLSLTVQMILDV